MQNFETSTPTLVTGRPIDLEKANLTSVQSPDPYSQPPKQNGQENHSLPDPNLVEWDGAADPSNPLNWPFRKKWIVTTVVSCFTFMSPLASSMIAPALPAISQEFGIIPRSVVESLTLSIFILAYAIGPLFWGPLSEIYGRLIVLQLSNLIFLAFNIACGFARTTEQMLAFRFLAGLGGSAPLAIGGGTIGDLFKPEERGKALSVYTLAPLTGPALGPIIGSWISERTTWRWVFFATSIADGAIQVLGFIFLRETYTPKLLRDKSRRLRKSTGNEQLRSKFDDEAGWAKIVTVGLVRPLTLLATQPILQVLALYQAILYGIMYLTLTTFSALFKQRYHQSTGIAGLHYIALGLGFTLGCQISARVLDKIYKKLKARNGGNGNPEMRMPLMMVTSIFIPAGLLLYGWSAQKHYFWFVPDLGAFIFSFGIVGGFIATQSYIVDNFNIYAASAIAASSAFRSLAGFGFPLFANKLFDSLGLGWGNSLLALVAFVIGCPSPFIFYKFGAKLRAYSALTPKQ